MKRENLIALACMISLLLAATNASAKYITLTHSISMERISSYGDSQINISMSNAGDEAAYDVQTTLILPDGMTSSPLYFGRMDPNVPQSAEFNLSIGEGLKPGRYSYAILTEYKDANGYPFSSVTPYYIALTELKTSQISGLITETNLSEKETKKLTLTLRNLEDKERQVNVRLFVPKELKIVPEEQTITMGARSETKIEFDASTFGALVGSRYIVFASLDYEDETGHYSSTAHGLVGVVKGGGSMIDVNAYLPYIIGLLVILVIAYQLKK